MTIVDALKTYSGNTLRLFNCGARGGPRWLIWDAKTQEYQVYASADFVQLGVIIYHGTDESAAVAVLMAETSDIFRNDYQWPEEP